MSITHVNSPDPHSYLTILPSVHLYIGALMASRLWTPDELLRLNFCTCVVLLVLGLVFRSIPYTVLLTPVITHTVTQILTMKRFGL